MAIVRFGGFNEGSLLRRTLLHVATFVVGSLAFVTIVSLVLVTVAKGLLPQRGSSKADKDEQTTAATDDEGAPSPISTAKAKAKKPRRPAVAAPTPASDDE